MLDKEKHPHFWKATYCSIMFLLVYSPQNIVLNIMSGLLEKHFGTLGFATDATLYLSQTLGALIGPSIIKKMGMKKIFIIGGVCFSLILIVQILPSWYSYLEDNPAEKLKVDGKWYSFLVDHTFICVILVMSSVISGCGLSWLWICQGEYMTMCATDSTKGFYFGYFWVWYMSS